MAASRLRHYRVSWKLRIIRFILAPNGEQTSLIGRRGRSVQHACHAHRRAINATWDYKNYINCFCVSHWAWLAATYTFDSPGCCSDFKCRQATLRHHYTLDHCLPCALIIKVPLTGNAPHSNYKIVINVQFTQWKPTVNFPKIASIIQLFYSFRLVKCSTSSSGKYLKVCCILTWRN